MNATFNITAYPPFYQINLIRKDNHNKDKTYSCKERLNIISSYTNTAKKVQPGERQL